MMNRPLPIANTLLILLGLLILFHVCVITGWISPDIVWGGRIDTRQELIHMELASISMLLLFALIILVKIHVIDMDWIKPLAQLGLWLMAIFFLINTVTNILAIGSFERYLFAPTSLVLGLLTIRLALIKVSPNQEDEPRPA